MSDEGVTRREAVDRLTKLVALAAGLSVSEVREILAASQQQAIRQTPKVRQLQMAVNYDIKALKVILSRDRSVFEREFGKTAPPKEVSVYDPVSRGFKTGMTCGEDYQDGGSCSSLSCGTHGCSEEDQGSCTNTNVCGDQDCGTLDDCGQNWCSDQKCSGFDECDKNEQHIVSRDFLDRYKTDPYVQDLFKEHNVRTSSELAARLQMMVKQRRRELSIIKR